MGGSPAFRNEREQVPPRRAESRGALTMQQREKISTGPNAEALDENIAGTAPGIPDDGLAPGEKALPLPPTDEEVEEAEEKLGAPKREVDSLPLDGE